ncbi:hypothetical protein FACS1894126_6130 [Alphaproteobacteria bacterium]|nr:hypothetical protein FACS1894126_6130 [Alphaproteobacteria bacterium]
MGETAQRTAYRQDDSTIGFIDATWEPAWRKASFRKRLHAGADELVVSKEGDESRWSEGAQLLNFI